MLAGSHTEDGWRQTGEGSGRGAVCKQIGGGFIHERAGKHESDGAAYPGLREQQMCVEENGEELEVMMGWGGDNAAQQGRSWG